jgi:hypothetical protein
MDPTTSKPDTHRSPTRRVQYDACAFKKHSARVSRDAQIAQRSRGEPVVERELDAGAAYIEGRGDPLDRRQDLDLRIRRPTVRATPLVRSHGGANLRAVARSRRPSRTMFWRFRAHALRGVAWSRLRPRVSPCPSQGRMSMMDYMNEQSPRNSLRRQRRFQR